MDAVRGPGSAGDDGGAASGGSIEIQSITTAASAQATGGVASGERAPYKPMSTDTGEPPPPGDDRTDTAPDGSPSAHDNIGPGEGLRQRRRNGVSADQAEGDGRSVPAATTTTTTALEDKGKGPDGTAADPAGAAADPSDGEAGVASDEFSCNICFDTSTDPVLTLCGHLFCWSCLVQWLERSATCPVCKAGCDKEKVIPVYGRGKEEKDPRLNANMPNRPAGRRPPAPPPRQANQFFGFDPFGVPGSFHGVGMGVGRGGGGGAVFVGGFGFLPALMGFSSFSGGQPGGGAPGTGQPVGQQAFASRVLMMLAAMILMSILFY